MIKINSDQDFIKELIKQHENEEFDFKQSINSAQKIAKTIVAFANTRGGKILIGVSDHKKIVGIDSDEEMYMLEKASKEYCKPPIQPNYEILEYKKFNSENSYEEIYLLLVQIPQSEFIHFAVDDSGTNKYYKRIKDKNLPQDING
jgi:predicted HTH transcriptional regulator